MKYLTKFILMAFIQNLIICLRLHITYPPEFCKTRYFFIDFDKPYHYYDGIFEIMEPEELKGFIVFERHIEYCCPIDIQLEDTLFDL